MPVARGRSLLGRFAHAPTLGAVEIVEDALLRVGPDGVIEELIPAGDPRHAGAVASAEAAGTLVRLPASGWVLPGFVDLHVHAPQYAQLGTALDRPLEEWLVDYTFPLEARFADLAFADRVYSALVADLLALGTTTALMFATVHQEATRRLVDLSLEHGLRALVGKVAMDDPDQCPDYYSDASPAASVEGTRALIEYVRNHPGNGEGWRCPSSPRASCPAARTPHSAGWANWRPTTPVTCRRTARRATGPRATSRPAPGAATPSTWTPWGSSRPRRSWRTRCS